MPDRDSDRSPVDGAVPTLAGVVRSERLSSGSQGRGGWLLGIGLLAVAVVIVAIFFAARRANDAPNVDVADVTPARSSRSTVNDDSSPSDAAPAAIPGLAQRETLHSVADQVRFVDPGSDEWSTEGQGALAARRLEQIGDYIRHVGAASTALPADLAAADFRGEPLRPTGDVVFGDGLWEVRHAQSPVSSASGSAAHDGAAGLRDSLDDLVRPMAGAELVHVKFKVIRVEESATEVVTTAYYQGDAETTTGRIQQNATWHCRWQRAADGAALRLTAIDVEDYWEVAARSPKKLFVDCTDSVLGGNACYPEQFRHGIDYWQSRLDGSFGIDVAALEGVAVGDVDGDGLEDLYVCQTGGLPNRLFLRAADGTARDCAAEAGVDWQELSRSALLIDLDNDDDQDLVVAMRYQVLFMANDGEGRFALKSTWTSAADLFSMAAADYDADGDLDVYVCARNDTNSAFRHGALGTPIPYHDANNGAANALLENRGDWRMVDVTSDVGLDENNRRFSYAATWDDFDNDGDQDLYVANDHGRNNLYQNDGGRFRDVAGAAGVEDMAAGMSASWGDFNRDGLMDIYVSNMFSSAGGRITYQRHFHDEAGRQTQSQYRRHTRGNTLFAADGNGRFEDVSEAAHVTMGRWAWGSIFFDMNNDGWQDIYVTNGFVTGPSTDDL